MQQLLFCDTPSLSALNYTGHKQGTLSLKRQVDVYTALSFSDFD
jgi:hypothetical protein